MVQRFAPCIEHERGWNDSISFPGMKQDPNGEYVKLQTYRDEQAMLKAQIQRLQTSLAAERERCATICDSLSTLYPDKEVGFDMGYTMGVTRAARMIRGEQ